MSEDPTKIKKVEKEKLFRICLMLNARTLEKVSKVQALKNFNTRTAAVVEIINAFRI